MSKSTVAALLGTLVAIGAAGSLSAQTVVFENVRVVDVEAATSSEPSTVHVRDGWIVDAATVDGDEVQRIDASGRYLIPGLAEMHAHVPSSADRQGVDDVLALFLAHGVTTIRGMLGEPGHIALRAELARGDRPGPRLITSGPSLNGNSVPDVERARELVRRQAEAGYDFLKLHPGLLPDTFAAIVDAANGLDIDFAGHVSIGVGLERALAAGQATIDHLDGYAQVLVPEGDPARRREPGFFGFNIASAMDPDRVDEWARRTADAGVWNVPTQTLIENLATGDVDALLERPAMRWVAEETRAQWVARIEQMRASAEAEALAHFVAVRRALIEALHDSGAGVLLGADAPQIMNVPGDALHHELEIYVEAGLSPAEALATGTVNVAEFLGQSALGCLEPGCVADLVLLNADPLADISNVRRIRGVMRAGEWFDRARLDAMLSAVEARANPAGPD
ncbi:MAG: amidohydrolase family protein [Wenzhouxiangellaceae bacterium]|nr:amidohydrolase family protein [Wenzhouxiangellaceae bacterium]MBS3822745.1 amidohydrolase family protein [Wenzhouxiangellaceae bacterium]